MSDITQIGNNINGDTRSVSINGNGDRIAIGIASANSNTGQTKIYEWNGISWIQLGQDIDGEASGDYSGWSVSLNSSGNIVAIGAPENNQNRGNVRIYQYDSDTNNWNQLGSDIDGEASRDESGNSVSLNSIGDIVAIGAPLNFNYEIGFIYVGHTRIYKYDSSSTNWVQLGQDIDGENEINLSGYSVSLNSIGDIVAIGAIYNGSFNGHTRIYQYDSDTNTWTQLGQDIDGEASGDESGYSVSLNSLGDIVAIGANKNDGGGSNSGHTRIFQYNGTDTWTQLGQDIDGESADDKSGNSVSLNSIGDIVAIGASRNDENGSNSGNTRIYQYNSDTDIWVQFGNDIDGEDADDRFGTSVSINNLGNIVAISSSNYTKVYQLDIDLNLDNLINSDVSMVPEIIKKKIVPKKKYIYLFNNTTGCKRRVLC